ncbi:serine/threonine-protein kinase [Nocardia coubleae]|uniref:non-specific serine/threonine protein kinase n=1 Tax=Nocardia coubleae TaxID=356147 RepID=A0A846W3R4_9NOCA|nr:serine/threonine-protein kinase [Nocardia coubleae]NKX87238.1 serine/threonine protein kinase [Nocardia coubleae]
MLNNGAMIADRYRLQRLIATGGMGQVWEAMDTRLDRRVAVKVLKTEFSADPTFRQRFRVEARTTAQLNAPGIAGIYDYGETTDPSGGETAYLVMELVQGEPLNAVLNRMGRLSVIQGLDMLEQTGRALEVAHAAGVVHRDVKPGNILVTPTGQVKITDFGIAKAVDASPVTKTGMVMGTAQYIAPEQAVGEDATAASDVYSLGVVGYEALAGVRPFTGEGAITVAMKHVRDAPPPLPADLPANVHELIAITMAKDPAQRYRSGGEFADAVAAVRAGHMPPVPGGAAASMTGATRVLPPGPTTVIPAADYDGATMRFGNQPPTGGYAGPATQAAAPAAVAATNDAKNNQKWLISLGVGALLLGGGVIWLLFGGEPNRDTGPTTTTVQTTAPVAPPVTTTRPLPPPVTSEEPAPTQPDRPTTTTPEPTTTTEPPTTTPEPTTTKPEPTTTVPKTTKPEPTTTKPAAATTTRDKPRIPTFDLPFPNEDNNAVGPNIGQQ